MKKLRIAILVALCINLYGCDKDEKPTEGNNCGTRPYCRYVEMSLNSQIIVPHHADLNPGEGITMEGWARIDTYNGSNRLFCKRNTEDLEPGGYFMRPTVAFTHEQEMNDQYYMGSAVGGYKEGEAGEVEVPILVWAHFAVTSDGVHRRHYLNGELVAEFAEPEDADVLHQPNTEPLYLVKLLVDHSGLAELRLWNVARTGEEIRSTMNINVTSPMPGLVSVWPLAENFDDIIGGHDGTPKHLTDLSFKEWWMSE